MAPDDCSICLKDLVLVVEAGVVSLGISHHDCLQAWVLCQEVAASYILQSWIDSAPGAPNYILLPSSAD